MDQEIDSELKSRIWKELKMTSVVLIGVIPIVGVGMILAFRAEKAPKLSRHFTTFQVLQQIGIQI